MRTVFEQRWQKLALLIPCSRPIGPTYATDSRNGRAAVHNQLGAGHERRFF